MPFKPQEIQIQQRFCEIRKKNGEIPASQRGNRGVLQGTFRYAGRIFGFFFEIGIKSVKSIDKGVLL